MLVVNTRQTVQTHAKTRTRALSSCRADLPRVFAIGAWHRARDA
jgi:hypothetical protein